MFNADKSHDLTQMHDEISHLVTLYTDSDGGLYIDPAAGNNELMLIKMYPSDEQKLYSDEIYDGFITDDGTIIFKIQRSA